MKNVLIIASLLFYAYWAKNRFWPKQKDISPATLTSLDNCYQKKMCAIVYIAPWCPACESVLPEIKNFVKNSNKNPDYGLQVIVGAERTAGDNKRKASQIGEGVIADDSFVIGNKLKIEYFPTFYVVDNKNQKIIKSDQAAFSWMAENFSN